MKSTLETKVAVGMIIFFLVLLIIDHFIDILPGN